MRLAREQRLGEMPLGRFELTAHAQHIGKMKLGIGQSRVAPDNDFQQSQGFGFPTAGQSGQRRLE